MNFQSIENYITQFPIYQYTFLSIDDIEFNDKVRTICKRECPRYGKSWSCPPAVGTVDKCRERCQQYTHALLFSSVAEVPDYSNMDALLATKQEHEEITAKIEAFLKQDAWRCYTLSTDSCSICEKCTYPKKSCNHPDLMHPFLMVVFLPVFPRLPHWMSLSLHRSPAALPLYYFPVRPLTTPDSSLSGQLSFSRNY